MKEPDDTPGDIPGDLTPINPDLAEWLMRQGIASISLNPDTVISTWKRLAAAVPPGELAD